MGRRGASHIRQGGVGPARQSAGPEEAVPDPPDVLRCGPIWVSPEDWCEVRVYGKPVAMPATRIRILAGLMRARGGVVSRDALYEAAGLEKSTALTRSIDIHIARLRKDLGELGRYIVSIRNRGYRLNVASLLQERK
jgi:DNA-binding response OmpR family regulator